MGARQVGVEEELLLVEPGSGQPLAVASAVMQAGDALRAQAAARGGADSGSAPPAPLDFEMQAQQLETSTLPCDSIDELGRELRRCRAEAAAAAGRAGARIAALGTSPIAVTPEIADVDRYRQMAGEFGLTAQEQLTCACHVHVEIASPDEGVAALDRIRPWLAPLLALSANSPYWQGKDSEYASFRYQAWGRWPSSGTTDRFGSARAYEATVREMVQTGALLDAGMVYFDARLSQRYPTIEVRIADVCLRGDDAALIAVLIRALVETEARAWRQGHPGRPVRTELLRLAAWRASRSGLSGVLISPATGKPVAAAAVVAMFLEHVRDALAENDEYDVVAELLAAVLARGNGAAFQRDSYLRSGRLAAVVTAAADATVA